MRRALLMATAVEAFFLLVLLGYGPLYLREAFHATDVVSSLAAAAPALATFLGSIFWGHRLGKVGLRSTALIALAGYLAMALVIGFAGNPSMYIGGVFLTALCSSALAPTTLTFLTQEGGEIGRRLATRIQWQSSGWVLGGILGGYIDSLATRAFPDMMLGLGVLMIGPGLALIGIAGPQTDDMVPLTGREENAGTLRSMRRLTLLLVLPFFLAYAGNEGFFTNFGLYLHALHVPTGWVGWSSSISTGLGWLMASRVGRWSDRFGGKALLMRVLAVYTAMYLIMSLASSHVVVVIAFSLPLYPLLNVGIQRAVAESLPPRNHGAAMGIINGASGLATFGGSALMGSASTLFGPHAMPWTAALLVFVGLLAAALIYRRYPVPGRAS